MASVKPAAGLPFAAARAADSPQGPCAQRLIPAAALPSCASRASLPCALPGCAAAARPALLRVSVAPSIPPPGCVAASAGIIPWLFNSQIASLGNVTIEWYFVKFPEAIEVRAPRARPPPPPSAPLLCGPSAPSLSPTAAPPRPPPPGRKRLQLQAPLHFRHAQARRRVLCVCLFFSPFTSARPDSGASHPPSPPARRRVHADRHPPPVHALLRHLPNLLLPGTRPSHPTHPPSHPTIHHQPKSTNPRVQVVTGRSVVSGDDLDEKLWTWMNPFSPRLWGCLVAAWLSTARPAAAPQRTYRTHLLISAHTRTKNAGVAHVLAGARLTLRQRL